MVIVMEENINILNELNKGACMGMDSINIIKDKIKDKEFKNAVENIYKKYEEVSRNINKLYYKYDRVDDPKTTNPISKAMLWSGIEINTLADTSDSKLAEILLNGINMGIIEGRKIFNNKFSDIEVEDLIKEFIRMQEGSVEELKQYL
jgi:hypothetical protein